MTFGNLWPLAFLILVPVIIVLYLLKQRAKDEAFSSILLWKEIYKNIEAHTPWEKLKQNLLMYLQILGILLIIVSLMAPYLKNGGRGTENIIMVLDNSASMQYLYEGENSRLEEEIARATAYADRLSESSRVTLLISDSDAGIIYSGSDKAALKKTISEIKPSNEAGNLSGAAGLAASLANDMENSRVVLFTDTAFEIQPLLQSVGESAVTVVNLFSEGDNLSLDYISYSQEETLTVLVKLTNYAAHEVETDVNLYADDVLTDILPVTLPAEGSEVLFFENVEIEEKEEPVILRAEIQNKDALAADNSAAAAVVSQDIRRVLLLSEGNVFLEKALTVEDRIDLYKADDPDVLLLAEESFDLYIFDGMLPENMETLPEDSAFLFLNQHDNEKGAGYFQSEEQQNRVMLTFADNAAAGYASGFSFGVNAAHTYALPEWGRSLLTGNENKCVGYYGMRDAHPVAVIGFDIHETDLALQAEFPLFILALTEELLGVGISQVDIENFPAAEESFVTPVSAMEGAEEFTGTLTGGREIRNWFILAAIILLIAEWIVYTRQVKLGSKKRQFLVIRSIVLLCLLLAVLGINLTLKSQQSATVFLADMSDSVAGSKADIQEYIKDAIQNMPENNSAGVVTFGADTAIDQFVTDKKLFSAFTTTPQATATNIEKALSAGLSLFDDNMAKRLVLITDGSQNEGEMSVIAAALTQKNIDFNIIRLENETMRSKEVYVSGLETPDVIHVDDMFNVTVTVNSNVETAAIISLYAGRELKAQNEVRLNTGENQFVFQDVGKEGSIQSYRAVVEAAEDSITENNQYVTFSQVEAKPRLLIVEGEAGKGDEFAKLLDSVNMEYDKVTPSGTPDTVNELNQYKSIITIDVHYDDLRKGFTDNLDIYVRDYAGGFICIGGSNSYALGNYRNTVLEEVLPVNMELQGEKEIPKMAMAMVIDQSGSMTATSGANSAITALDLAKRAAIEGLESLRAIDEVGVLAFDDTYNWIVEPRLADNISEIESFIETIGYGGGTSIYPALAEAVRAVNEQDAVLKHIILLTDGQDGFREYQMLFDEINASGITVSTVAVGRDSDQVMLQNIANQCGGRFYYTDVNSSIPRIFAQEVYLSAKSYLINEDFVPVITGSSEIIAGVFDGGSPTLYGYVAATPKSTANVLLNSHRGDPILSTWQYGLGRTVAWNTDGTNEWTGNFAGWENYPRLWQNIIRYTISDTDLGEDHFSVEEAGNSTVITYNTKEYDTETTVTGIVTDENGNSSEVELIPVAPGKYEGRVASDEIGVYSLNIRKNQGGTVVKNTNTAIARQYSAEYQFLEDNGALESFVNQTAGKWITFENNIWEEKLENVNVKTSLTLPLLITALLLFMPDIIVRRFGIDLWGKIAAGRLKLRVILLRFTGRKPAADMSRTGKTAEIPRAAQTGETTEIPEPAQTGETAGIPGTAQTGEMVKTPDSKRIHKAKTKKNPEPEMLDMNQLLQRKQDRER